MSPFAPGAGAPTVRRWDWLCCRSTASVRTGPAQSTPHACPPSHPGRVLLRFGVEIGFVVGAPPSVRTGRARCEPGGVGFWFWGLKFRGRAPTSCPVALFSECLACSVYRLSCCWEQLCLPRL